eukprot:CAMPEP_0172399792 /NCGR_PEP_ID=MMETSP1061-20121228/42553_1 /TAXON_ID=37318 /ORGANISM="Pseudo-nitzschia pungens, Strain cf. pungens" /LENGTH=3066 /DNA_ID=CAMNT_0013132779 /DNA_START=162 /DNA_END=9362 /DNA_ORIENTATION=+
MLSMKALLLLATAALAAIAVASGEASTSSKLASTNGNEPETLDLKFSVRFPSDDDDASDDTDIEDFDDEDDDDDDDFYGDEDEEVEDALAMDDDDEYPSEAEIDAAYARRKLYNDRFKDRIDQYDTLRNGAEEIVPTDAPVAPLTEPPTEPPVATVAPTPNVTKNKNKKKNRKQIRQMLKNMTPEEKKKYKKDLRKKKRMARLSRQGKTFTKFTPKICKKLRKKFKKCKNRLRSKCKKYSKAERKTMRKKCKSKKKKWKQCESALLSTVPTASPDTVPSSAPSVSSKPSVFSPPVTTIPTHSASPSATPTTAPTLSSPKRNLLPTSAPTSLNGGIIDIEPSPNPNKSASLTTKAAIDQKTSPLIVEAAYKVVILDLLESVDIPKDSITLDVAANTTDCNDESSPKTCFLVDTTVTANPGSGADPDAIIDMIRKAIARGLFAKKIQNASGLTGVVISPSASSTSTAAFDKDSSPTPEAVEAAYKAAMKEVLTEGGMLADDVALGVTATKEKCDSKYSDKKCFKVESTTTVSPTSTIDPETATKKVEKSIALDEFEDKVEAASDLTGADISIPLDSASSFTTAAINESFEAGPSEIEAAYESALKSILDDEGISADNYVPAVQAEAVDCSASLKSKKCFDVQTTITTFPSSDVDPDDAIRIFRKAVARGILADKSGLTDAIVTNSPSATSITTASADPTTVAGFDATIDDVEAGYEAAIHSVLKDANIATDDVVIDLDVAEVDCSAKIPAKKCFGVEATIIAASGSGVDPEGVMEMIEKDIAKGEFADNVESKGLMDVVVSSAPTAKSLTTAKMDEATSAGGLATGLDVEAAYEEAIQSVLEESGISPDDVIVEVEAVAFDCDSSKKCFSVESLITPSPSSDVDPSAAIDAIKMSVAEGAFGEKIEAASVLQNVIVDNAPDSTSITSAMFDDKTVTGEGVTTADVDAAYEKVVADILKKANVSPDDVLVEIEATDVDCTPASQLKECFYVEAAITAAPHSSVNPDAIVKKIKMAVANGDFAKQVEGNSGMTSALIANAPFITATSNVAVDPITSTGEATTAADVEAAFEMALLDLLDGANIPTEDILVEVEAVEVDCVEMSEKKCFKVDAIFTAIPGSDVDLDSILEAVEKAIAKGGFGAEVESLSDLTGAIINGSDSASSTSSLVTDNANASEEDVETGYENVIDEILKEMGIDPSDVFVEVEALETECEDSSSATKCYTVDTIVTAAPNSDVDPDEIIQKIEEAIANDKFEKELDRLSPDVTSPVVSQPLRFGTLFSSAAIDEDAAATADVVESAYKAAIDSILAEAGLTAGVHYTVGAEEAECDAELTGKKCFDVKTTVVVSPSVEVDPDDIIEKLEAAIAAGIFAEKVDESPDITGSIISTAPSSIAVTSAEFDENTSSGSSTTADDVESAYGEAIKDILTESNISPDDVLIDSVALEADCAAGVSSKKCFTVESAVTASPSSDADTGDIIKKIQAAVEKGNFAEKVEAGSELTSAVITNAPSVTSFTNAAVDELTGLGAAATAEELESAYEGAIEQVLEGAGISTDDVLVEVEAVAVDCAADLTSKKCYKVESILTASPSAGISLEDAVQAVAKDVATGDFGKKIEGLSDLTDVTISAGQAASSVSLASVDDNTAASKENLESAYEGAIQSLMKDANISPDDVFVEVEAMEVDCEASLSSKKCYSVTSKITASPTASDVDPLGLLQDIEMAIAQGDFADLVESESDLTGTSITVPLLSASAVSNASIDEDSTATADDIEAAYKDAINDILEQENIKPNQVIVEVAAVEQKCGSDSTGKKCFSVETTVSTTPSSGVDPEDIIAKMKTSIAEDIFEGKIDEAPGVSGPDVTNAPSSTSLSTASVSESSKTGTEVTAEDIEAAYEGAIQSALLKENIGADDVIVDANAVEVDCGADESSKKCYSVETVVTSTPSSGVDPDTAVEKIQSSIAEGDLATAIEANSILEDVVLSNAPSSTSLALASFDESTATSPEYVESVYEDIVKDILKESGMLTDGVFVEVEAVPTDCPAELSGKKCFDVETKITASPSSGVDADAAVDKIQSSIDQGDLASGIEASSNLTDAVITNAPSSTSSANAAFDAGTMESEDDVEKAFETAIDEILADIVDDVLVEVEAVEVECTEDLADKKCFDVETTITASPSSGVDTGTAMQQVQQGILDGELAANIEENSDATGVVVSLPLDTSSADSIVEVDENKTDGTPVTEEDVEESYKDVVEDILGENNMGSNVTVTVDAVEGQCAEGVSDKKCFDVDTAIATLPTSGIDTDDAIKLVNQAITLGEFDDKMDESSDLEASNVTLPVDSSSSNSVAVVDELTSEGIPVTEEFVEGAYNDIIKGIFDENNKIDPDSVTFDVDAVEGTCGPDVSSGKKCFDVETTVTAAPDSEVSSDDAVKLVEKAIGSGIFDDKLGDSSGLTDGVVTIPVTTEAPSSSPTAMPSASTLTNAAFNRRTAGKVVEAAYEVAIKQILEDEGISEDGLVLDVDAVEGKCGPDKADKKCFEAEITVAATPSSGKDPESVIEAIEKAIESGKFAQLIEGAGVSGGVIGLGPLTGASSSLTTIASTDDDAVTSADVAKAYDGAVQAILDEEGIDSDDISVGIKSVDAVCEEETAKDNCFRVDVTVTADSESDADPDAIINKLKAAIANGSFDQLLANAGLADVAASVPVPKSASLVTDASFAETSTTEDEVEDGYNAVIEDIIKDAKINPDDVVVVVEASPVSCETEATGSCFSVKSTVTAEPGSGVDPESIIEKLYDAIADGKFADKLGEQPGLTGADVSLPSASLVMGASFGDPATSTEDVEAGYKTAIDDILEDAEITSEDVTYEVEAVEVSCDADSSARKCFDVEITVTATPTSDVDPKDVIKLLRAAVIAGSFEEDLAKTGLVDPEISVPMDPTPSPTMSPTISMAPTTYLPKCKVSRLEDPNNLVDVMTAISNGWIEATFNRRLENVRCVKCVEVYFENCRDVECVEAGSCLDTAFASTVDIFDPTTVQETNVQCIGDKSCKRSSFTGVDGITCRGEDSCARASVKRSYEVDCKTDDSCRGLAFA